MGDCGFHHEHGILDGTFLALSSGPGGAGRAQVLLSQRRVLAGTGFARRSSFGPPTISIPLDLTIGASPPWASVVSVSCGSASDLFSFRTNSVICGTD